MTALRSRRPGRRRPGSAASVRLPQGEYVGDIDRIQGFLGLEDNEAIKFVQDGMRSVPGGEHLVKLDPNTPAGTADTLISEAAIRAMYRHWRQAMDL